MRWSSFLPADANVRRSWTWDAWAGFFFAFFMALIYPFIGVHAARLGAAGWQIGVLTSAPFIGFSLGSVWGALAERGPKKPWVVWFHSAARLSLLPLGFITNMTWFLVVVVLHHVLHTAPMPAYGSMMQKIYPAESRGRLMAYVRAVVMACFLLVNRPAGALIDAWGPGWIWAAGSLFGFLSTLCFQMVDEPDTTGPARAARPSVLATWRLLLQDRQFAVLQSGFFIFGFGNLMMLPLYPQYYVQVLDLVNSEVALIASTGALVGLGGMLLAGRLIDRTQPLYSCILSAFSYGMAPVTLFLGGSLPAAMLAQGFFAAGDALGDLGWQNHILRTRGDKASSYLGLHISLLGLAVFWGLLPAVSYSHYMALTPPS